MCLVVRYTNGLPNVVAPHVAPAFWLHGSLHGVSDDASKRYRGLDEGHFIFVLRRFVLRLIHDISARYIPVTGMGSRQRVYANG